MALALASSGRTAPPRACIVDGDLRVAAGAEELALAVQGHQLTLVVAEQGRTSLAVYRGDGASITRAYAVPVGELLKTVAVAAPASGPALAAYSDARGVLRVARLGQRGLSDVRELATGLDVRFAPALSADEPAAIAFVKPVDQAMHTFVSVARGGVLPAPVDVTPASHGAASPAFVRGAPARTLLMIDAHAALSPLLELPIADKPGAAVVRRPVSQPAVPPLVRGFTWQGAPVHVAYTAIGKLAATAIGHVLTTDLEPPSALVPSSGYGELSLDVLARAHSAVLALEVPNDMPVTAPRHLELVVLDQQGEGSRLRLPAPEAKKPALAAGEGSAVWLGYLAPDGAHISRLACGE
jgi:hypothetical protein